MILAEIGFQKHRTTRGSVLAKYEPVVLNELYDLYDLFTYKLSCYNGGGVLSRFRCLSICFFLKILDELVEVGAALLNTYIHYELLVMNIVVFRTHELR